MNYVVVVILEDLISRSKHIGKKNPLEVLLFEWPYIFAQNMSVKHSIYLEDPISS